VIKNSFMKHKRLSLILLAVAVMLAVAVGGFALAIDDRTPEQIVEETSTTVLNTINEDNAALREDPTLINSLVNDTVIPIIDLDSMGKLILGKYWKTASAEQRTSFVSEFKDMLIRTYAKSLVDYGHEWKVFDLAVDGLSLVKNFRTSFSQEIRETSLDALIERLASTNKTGSTDVVAE